MNLYQLASQDEAWGAYALDDDPTPWTAWPADPPAPVPPGPVPLDAALDAAAREYGVNADVLRALGPGGSVDSIFDTAASLRSRLEAFGGDYAQALASYRQAEEGQGSIALAAPAAAPLSPPDLADAQVPAPGPTPSARTAGPEPRPRPARPQAAARGPGAPPPQAARPDQPPAPPDGRLGAADDPRSLLYRPAPAAQKPLVDEVKSQLASGAKTLARMLPATGAAAHWVATQGEPVASKTAPANVGSVLERVALPAPDLPSRDLPLRPEVRQAANNAWDAATPQDRQRMQSLPGWQGQLARERAAQFAQADQGILAGSPVAALFDPRAEGRTKTLIAKGEHPDFARRAAREGAAAGVAPGQEVKALGGTVQPSTYDFETQNLFDPNRPANLLNTTVGRGVAKGGLGLGKGVVGIAQLIEDGIGADDATKQRTADRANALRSMEQAIGERGTHLQRNAEGAIASITQQLPMLVTGSFVPSQLLSMGSIAAQSFGQEYSDGKSRGLDPQQAAGRAGAFAAFEVIGEKFGFKGNMEAIRKATQGMPSDALAGFLANLVKKEIPGEVLTTTGQFAVDKWAPAGMALKPDATLGDYVRQLGDTITQTMLQGGMMSGGRRVLAGGATPSAPRVQRQSTTPNAPHAQEATYESGPGSTTAPAPAPSPSSTAPATGYDGAPMPGNATWSEVATATRKAQAEAETLRQAEALPEQDAATGTIATQHRVTQSTIAATPTPASPDGNGSGMPQAANALQQGQATSDAGQVGTTPQASATYPAAHAPGTSVPAPAHSTANAQADASTAETAPAATTQQGSARHTAAAQVPAPTPAPAPVAAQVQALDSGMLVIGGDQSTILAHLHAGGVRGAEPFMGATIVPVHQAALAQQVLSRPLAASAGPQADSGFQRTSTTANPPQNSTAAQRAPSTNPGGTSITASNSAGLSASRTGHSARRNAPDAEMPQPGPAMEMQRDGTLMVKGDPAQLQERLRAGGVSSVLRRKGGVLVGLDQVDKARLFLRASYPHQPVQIREGAATAASPPINALYGSSVAFKSPADTSIAPAGGDGQAQARILEQARILQGEPVAALNGNEAPHGYPLLRDWAVRLFQGFGNKATNREIGQVVLDERSVRDSMAHRMNPYKAVAFAAARQVVEQGALVLSAQHSRDTTGHFISAPVTIAGVENIVTVLVRTTPNSQRMYLHSAITKESLLKSGNSGADTVDGVERSGKATSGDMSSVLRRLLTVNVEVPVASVAKPASHHATPKFSTHSGNPAPGLSSEQVQELVQQALSGLSNPPPVDIVGRSEEAWIGAPEGVMGAALPEEGRIVIVASAHLNADAVLETLFHEMFHLGVRNVLPSRDYVQSMLDLAKRDRRVQQYAIEWKAKAPDAPHQLRVLRERGFTGTELTAQYEALAIEEGLAVVAQELRAQKLAGTRLGMRIRKLANWLASVADRMGMGRLAASIRAMTYNEAERFVMRAIDQAEAVGAKTLHTGQTRFSTRSAQDPSAGLQTDDTNDGTQPLHSMRMEMQRDGTLMVRGDPVQLQERLRQGGVERVLRREGGVLVGLDQVGKARQVLQRQPQRSQVSTGPSLPSSLSVQQFSRSAPPSPDRPSRARGLPSQPATVQSVKAAVAKLVNSMGLLAEGRGRVVVATSADIQAHWEPLIGEVDMGSPDSGLAQGFYDPNTDTVFLIADHIADHIEAGQEMAVAAHELVHKHGKAVLGEAGWRQMHEVIGNWANKPEGSLERRVYDEAAARVQASRPDSADAATYSSEELFPYAVQVAMELGVQPTALMPNNSVQGWLARVRASLKDVLGKLTGNPQAFDGQDLVDLAFGIAQLARSASAPSGLERPNGSAPSTPYRPIQMSRDAGKDGAGAAPEKGPLGSKDNPRPVPLTDFKVRITTDNDPSNAITMLVDGEDVDFASIEIKNGSPVLVVGKNGKNKSGEHVIIDAHGVTEAMLKAVISYYIETTGSPPIELPGSLAYDNLKNFQKEFDKHRKNNHNGTADDWAQAAVRDMSFGKARQKIGYGVFEIKLSGSVNVGDLKGVPEEINVIARRD